MDHAGPGRDGVRRRPGRRAHDQAVTLHAGHVFPVDEEVDIREVRRRTAIDHDLVQHQQIRLQFGRFALLSFPRDGTVQTAPQGQGRVT